MEKLIAKPLATKVSLNELMVGVITGMYDYEEPSMLRITSELKPGFTVLCVEADVSDSVSSFMRNLSADPAYNGSATVETPFEGTVFDFLVVSVRPDIDTNVPTLMSMSLQELFTMNSAVERGAGDDDFGHLNRNDWSPEIREWDVYELVTKESLLKVEPEIPTDMHILG